jgi:hypothetical protein
VNLAIHFYNSVTVSILSIVTFVIKVLKQSLKPEIMGNKLYLISAILIVMWAVGFFVFKVGDIIDALLVIALIVIVFRVSQPRKTIIDSRN